VTRFADSVRLVFDEARVTVNVLMEDAEAAKPVAPP
jgi:hypothetical protein